MSYFLKLYDWVLLDNKLTTSEKLVFSKIIQMHDKPKGCIMTNEQLGLALGLSIASIKNALDTLKELEYIKVKVKRKQSSVERKIAPIQTEYLTRRSAEVAEKELKRVLGITK